MKFRELLYTLNFASCSGTVACLTIRASGAELTPAPQRFRQEVAVFEENKDWGQLPVQLIESTPTGEARAFVAGRWHEYRDGRWSLNESLSPKDDSQFAFAGPNGQRMEVPVPWR